MRKIFLFILLTLFLLPLAKASTYTYDANSISVISGSLSSGDVTSLHTAKDGNVLDISGSSFELQVTFINVTIFTNINIRERLDDGDSNTKVFLEIYNPHDSTWNRLDTHFIYGNDYTLHSVIISNPKDYINEGDNNKVIIRYVYDSGSFFSSDFYLDLTQLTGESQVSVTSKLYNFDMAGLFIGFIFIIWLFYKFYNQTIDRPYISIYFLYSIFLLLEGLIYLMRLYVAELSFDNKVAFISFFDNLLYFWGITLTFFTIYILFVLGKRVYEALIMASMGKRMKKRRY